MINKGSMFIFTLMACIIQASVCNSSFEVYKMALLEDEENVYGSKGNFLIHSWKY